MLSLSGCFSAWPCPSATHSPLEESLGKGTLKGRLLVWGLVPASPREQTQAGDGLLRDLSSRKFCCHGAWSRLGEI